MNLLVKSLPHKLPFPIQTVIIGELFTATAAAFACPVPAMDHLTFGGRLQVYARFTREQADQSLQSRSDLGEIKTRLFQNAYHLGEKLRKWFFIDKLDEVMELGEILYRAIEIDIEGDTQGIIWVKRCYFSQFYSAPICDLISALDDGIFSGLSGGCRLAFSERITEGKPCCRAKLALRREG